MPAHTGSYPIALSPEFFPISRRSAGSISPKWGSPAKFFAIAMALAVTVGFFAVQSVREENSAAQPKRFQISVPARVMANFFVVSAVGQSGEARHFIIDTGSSITHVTSEFAAHYATVSDSSVTVQAPTGREVSRARVTIERLTLGSAHFNQVPAVVSDLGELSNYLGVQIDGIVGFPVFKNYLLTLDYGRAEMTVALQGDARDLSNLGLVFPLNTESRVPFVTMHVADQRCEVLIDTGSDGGLSLNPENVDLTLIGPARAGALVSTVAGDRRQYLARIANRVEIGGTGIEQPVVDFTLGTASVGGDVLRNFVLTFDQKRGEVTFRRATSGPVELAARRSVGLSFAREANAWAVAGIVPETPSANLDLQPGDRCVRINGETVDRWPAERYAQLLKSASKVTFTFARGQTQSDVQIPVVNLLE